MNKRLSVAAVTVVLGALLAACHPPPPPAAPRPPPAPPPPPPAPPPPPPGPMSLGWSAPGVTGPITADATENLVWATGSGFLWGLNATTGTQVAKDALALEGVQHFPTPNVVANWVVIEKSSHQVAGFPTPANTSGTPWISPDLGGEVQSRPVIVGNIVVVATEGDSLYGLDLLTGHIVWGGTAAAPTANFGTPEPLAEVQSLGSVPGCGNINPLGVTSNVVYDPTTTKVYAVGERETGTTSPHPPEFVMVSVDPTNGALTVPASNLNAPLGLDVPRQQQRAGLAAANGNVYVGFGGLAGDCGNYHGYVVKASEATGAVVGSFEVAAANGGNGAGAVWGTSGPVIDSSGNVYASTGNSFNWPASGTDYSDAVVKLSPAMTGATTAPADYFQPTVWRSDNAVDADLGSSGPVFAASETQLFEIGKQHLAFLLNTSSLGGADHETPIGTVNACSGVADGQNAVIGLSAYVACSSGIQQVHLG